VRKLSFLCLHFNLFLSGDDFNEERRSLCEGEDQLADGVRVYDESRWNELERDGDD
jgi:hypothetical protein